MISASSTRFVPGILPEEWNQELLFRSHLRTRIKFEETNGMQEKFFSRGGGGKGRVQAGRKLVEIPKVSRGTVLPAAIDACYQLRMFYCSQSDMILPSTIDEVLWARARSLLMTYLV